MQIKNIKINNVTSFLNFKNDTDFQKNNLIFGTNGSGKSTLASLLLCLNRYKQNPSIESESLLKEFLKQRFSKEATDQIVEIEIIFNSNSEKIDYDIKNDKLSCSNSAWFPIKVFNDEYTELNIGDNIDVNLEDNGLIIGETNKDLDLALKNKTAIESHLENKKKDAVRLIEEAIIEFKEITDSSRNVENIISVDNLFNETCTFTQDSNLIKKRKNIGFSAPSVAPAKIQELLFELTLNIPSIEAQCTELIPLPAISENIKSLLLNYTDFFNIGITIYDKEQGKECPFCRQSWKISEEMIDQYKKFLQSTYNTTREAIKKIENELENYKRKVTDQIKAISQLKLNVDIEASKYAIDTSSWQNIVYDDKTHKKILMLLEQKYEHMENSISLEKDLNSLENFHISLVKNNNKIIIEIEKAIVSITTQRRQLNLDIAKHCMKKQWTKHAQTRTKFNELCLELATLNKKIEILEKTNKSQDTIQKVFNDLLKFLTLSEYFIDKNKKLNIKINKDYDISNEGKRISTAQRKMLSLCYFFAEIVSSIKNISELKNYILVFDDPVDSADYIHFHSIVTVIEKNEKILSTILERKIKLGQFFIFTHNSLLYNRLTCSWQKYGKWLKKVDNCSALYPANRRVNNYALYIDEIIRYYKNPKTDKKRRAYVGNLIRRVLEILSSFNNLGNEDFQGCLDGMGKSKLALIANHLSHDSFSKVLNPLQDGDELKEACKELLEVIRENHPIQYETIITNHELVV